MPLTSFEIDNTYRNLKHNKKGPSAGRFLSQLQNYTPTIMNKTSYGKSLTSNNYYIDKLSKNAAGLNTCLNQTFVKSRQENYADQRRFSDSNTLLSPQLKLNMVKYGNSRIH